MGTIPRKRRGTRLSERLTPCEACGYVLSQRHHLLPAGRYGETEHTAQLCANCHETYHILEQGWIDIRAGRRNTRPMYLYDALWRAYGGRDNPSFDKLCVMVEQSEVLQHRNAARSDFFDMFQFLFGPELGESVKEIEDIRRGDTVRLTDGKVVRVVSVAGGYVHTTEGTYAPWQVAKIAKS